MLREKVADAAESLVDRTHFISLTRTFKLLLDVCQISHVCLNQLNFWNAQCPSLKAISISYQFSYQRSSFMKLPYHQIKKFRMPFKLATLQCWCRIVKIDHSPLTHTHNVARETYDDLQNLTKMLSKNVHRLINRVFRQISYVISLEMIFWHLLLWWLMLQDFFESANCEETGIDARFTLFGYIGTEWLIVGAS